MSPTLLPVLHPRKAFVLIKPLEGGNMRSTTSQRSSTATDSHLSLLLGPCWASCTVFLKQHGSATTTASQSCLQTQSCSLTSITSTTAFPPCISCSQQQPPGSPLHAALHWPLRTLEGFLLNSWIEITLQCSTEHTGRGKKSQLVSSK